MIREDLISGRRKSAVRGTFEMVAVNEVGRPVPDHCASDNQSNRRGSRVLKQHGVRTFKSAEHLARDDQLAWKIAEVAADPVAVESDVAEMIVNRIIDNAAVAVGLVARAPGRRTRAPRRWPIRAARRRDGVRRCRGAARARRNGRPGPTASRCASSTSTTPSWPPTIPIPATTSRRSLAVAQHCGLTGADLVRGIAAGLRDPGRPGEGHLPARAQDRPHRPSRPVGRRPASARCSAAGRDDLPGDAAGAARHHHDAAVAQGRDLQLEGLRPGLRRQDGDRGGRPRHARRRRAVARSTRARTASSPGCSAARRPSTTCRCPEAGEPKRAILDTYTKEHSAEYQSQALIDLARRMRGRRSATSAEVERSSSTPATTPTT